MSQARTVAFAFAPTQADEAKGVTIRRSIGGERLAILDPFMLLDHASIAPGTETVGFPRHPHRGIETLSYVLRGRVGHKDSMGKEGEVGPGGTQWMTAGNGIYHEEMLLPEADGAEFLQLWFSLPRTQKRIAPGYLGVAGADVPEVNQSGVTIRVVSGQVGEVLGAFTQIATKPTVVDLLLEPNSTLDLPCDPQESGFAYLVSGSIELDGRTLSGTQMAVLTNGDRLQMSAGAEGARVFYVSAKPLNEPIIQYRSFVMNTIEDIHETVAMIEAGTFANG